VTLPETKTNLKLGIPGKTDFQGIVWPQKQN
jgi:hypothetical protein